MPGVLTSGPVKVESPATVALIDRAGQGLIVGALRKHRASTAGLGEHHNRESSFAADNGRHFLVERFLDEVSGDPFVGRALAKRSHGA
jgi:hypothetical protein